MAGLMSFRGILCSLSFRGLFLFGHMHLLDYNIVTRKLCGLLIERERTTREWLDFHFGLWCVGLVDLWCLSLWPQHSIKLNQGQYL